MSWVYLGLAILLEVCGTLSLKMSNGMENMKYTVAMAVFYMASFSVLSLALKEIEVGVAYAVWCGIGIAIITTIGIIYFGESVTLAKMLCISLILIGAVGLKLFGAPH